MVAERGDPTVLVLKPPVCAPITGWSMPPQRPSWRRPKRSTRKL